MQILKDESLKEHNTFGIAAQTDWLIRYSTLEDLELLHRDEYVQELRKLHIGEGSNLLFLSNFHGAILKSDILTYEELSRTEDEVILRAGSGLVWDSFVGRAVSEGLYGLENLSGIPGTVGASAIQNIGAYGVEVGECILAVEAFNLKTGERKTFEQKDCSYAYRYSIFKEPEMQDWVIHHVLYRLSRSARVNLSYPDLSRRFEGKGEPTPAEVREAILEIRSSKLPDPKVLGNAGSFFMNPILGEAECLALKALVPEVPSYALPDGRYKVPAGWLIDRAGFKGYRRDRVGVYERQALVLVNYGGATGQEVARLAEDISQAVYESFGIRIEPEVRYVFN